MVFKQFSLGWCIEISDSWFTVGYHFTAWETDQWLEAFSRLGYPGINTWSIILKCDIVRDRFSIYWTAMLRVFGK